MRKVSDLMLVRAGDGLRPRSLPRDLASKVLQRAKHLAAPWKLRPADERGRIPELRTKSFFKIPDAPGP